MFNEIVLISADRFFCSSAKQPGTELVSKNETKEITWTNLKRPVLVLDSVPELQFN